MRHFGLRSILGYRWLALAVVVIACACWTPSAGSQHAGPNVQINEAMTTDLYAAGERIRVSADVGGDVVVAGADIAIDALVTADILAAGQAVTVSAPVGDDVRAAGYRVTIDGPVQGHLVAAARNIELTRRAKVSDWAWLAGQRVEVSGTFGDAVRAVGDTVIVDAQINGDVDVLANSLVLRPDTTIAGDLIWRGASMPRIGDEARIDGELIHKPADISAIDGPAWLKRLGRIGSVAFVAIVMSVGVPGIGARNEHIVRERPMLSLLSGVLFLVGTPLLIVLSMMTGIGWLLAAVLIALLIAAIFASSALGLAVAAQLARRSVALPGTLAVQRVLGIVAVALVVWLVGWIPMVTTPIYILLILLGLGATTIQVVRASRGMRTPTFADATPPGTSTP